jgi:hypothetical protein
MGTFFGWENWILCTGTGIHQKKNNKLGMELRFEHNSHDGISTLGHWDVAKIRAGKWE